MPEAQGKMKCRLSLEGDRKKRWPLSQSWEEAENLEAVLEKLVLISFTE